MLAANKPDAASFTQRLVQSSERQCNIQRSSVIRGTSQSQCSQPSTTKISLSTCVYSLLPGFILLIASAVFLLQLLIVIAFLLSEVLLPPSNSLLALSYKFMLQRLLPDAETEIVLHPYFASGLLFVSVTTLVLFFASGMYSEKIAYANK